MSKALFMSTLFILIGILYLSSTASEPVVASSPSPVAIWTDPQSRLMVITYRTALNQPRCYLMNGLGGQPIQIECPK